MKLHFPMFKKKYLLLLLIPPLFVFGYWIKCLFEINFFHSMSLSGYSPFKYLTNNVTWSPDPGVIFEENFDDPDSFKSWSELWMREPGTVTFESSTDEKNGSGCLLIKNNGTGSWAYDHKRLVEVNKGDVFSFQGLADIQSEGVSAALSVAEFDKHRKAIGWNVFKAMVPTSGTWIKVEKQFEIQDDNIKYISFRLVGTGNGIFRFDNIVLRKIK